MKLKLTKSEMQALELILCITLEINPVKFSDRICLALTKEMYISVRKKLIEPKSKYSLTLTEAQDLCLVMINESPLVWSKLPAYEMNFLHKTTNQIKQYYA